MSIDVNNQLQQPRLSFDPIVTIFPYLTELTLSDIEIDELDPYFDVKDYVEKTFRKTYDRVGNTFEFEALDPDDTEINS